jgi:TATA-box binding protein (TBP) (component of TFIID and TFIIIB)
MLIFANGKAVFTGAKEAKDVKWALYQIYPVLSRKSIITKVRICANVK